MCDCNLQCIMISLKCQYIKWITRYLLLEHILTFVRFTKIFRIHQSHPKKKLSRPDVYFTKKPQVIFMI